MSSLRPFRSTGLRGFLLGILVMAYAVAQYASLVHASEHLSQNRAIPHGVACQFCVAAVESSGGLTADVPVMMPIQLRHEAPDSLSILQLNEIRALHYRSRAPPVLV